MYLGEISSLFFYEMERFTLKNDYFFSEHFSNRKNVYTDIKQLISSKNQRTVFIVGLVIYFFMGFLFYDAQPVTRPDINVFHIVHFWQGFVTGLCFSNIFLVAFFNLVHELLEFQTSNETPIDKILDPIVFFIGYFIANKLFIGKIFTRFKEDLNTYFNKQYMYVFTFDFFFALTAWLLIQLTIVLGGIARSIFNQESLPISQIVNTLLIFTNLYTIIIIILAFLVIMAPLIISAWEYRDSFYNMNVLFTEYKNSDLEKI